MDRYAEESWHGGRALEAGKILYERLEVNRRPGWAAAVLDACCAGVVDVPAEVDAVRVIALTPARWSEAREAFGAVRRLHLAEELQAPNAPSVVLRLLRLAENVAKVTYTASGLRAPFDHHAGWRVAEDARAIVEHASSPALEARVWAALAMA